MDPFTAMAIGGAISGGLGAFSKDDEGGFEAIPSTPEQNKARGFLQNILYGDQIPTRDIAGMSDTELQGMELLKQFLGQAPGEERSSALGFLTGLLDQTVDVTQLPEIKALGEMVKNTFSPLVNSAFRRTQRSGMGDSGPQGSAVGRELAKGKTSMVAALAPYMSQVRGNQLSAANLINTLITGQDEAALGKVGAAASYGALPRLLAQAQSDADIEAIMANLQNKYNAAGRLLDETRYMYDPGTTSPPLGQDILQGAMGGLKFSKAMNTYDQNKMLNTYLQGNTYKPSVYPVH